MTRPSSCTCCARTRRACPRGQSRRKRLGAPAPLLKHQLLPTSVVHHVFSIRIKRRLVSIRAFLHGASQRSTGLRIQFSYILVLVVAGVILFVQRRMTGKDPTSLRGRTPRVAALAAAASARMRCRLRLVCCTTVAGAVLTRRSSGGMWEGTIATAGGPDTTIEPALLLLRPEWKPPRMFDIIDEPTPREDEGTTPAPSKALG